MKTIMIAGTGSGCGKTTITCGILAAFKKRGVRAAAFKCGPDYIDPMFHKEIIGVSSYNLDAFFCDDDTVNHLLCKNSADADISVIEGVMGFYDGFSSGGSAYSLSEKVKTSVIIVIDCKGMSDSLGAVMKGFLTYKVPNRICGFIFNRLPEKLVDLARELCQEMGVIFFGYFPANKMSIKSRHLGLVTAGEICDLKMRVSQLGGLAEKFIDLDRIMSVSERSPVSYAAPVFKKLSCSEPPVIAISYDKAFCFLYPDNINALTEIGCRVEFFSPLNDKKIPDNADGVIFCGGYPELYAEELSQNKEMLSSVKMRISDGIPVIAECGGSMYLHRELENDKGKKFPMAGVIDGISYKTEKLQRFGYVKLTAKHDNLLCKAEKEISAHEFHYWESSVCGSDFKAQKLGGASWECCICTDKMYAGFPHLYFYSDMDIAVRFAEACVKYGGKNEKDQFDRTDG